MWEKGFKFSHCVIITNECANDCDDGGCHDRISNTFSRDTIVRDASRTFAHTHTKNPRRVIARCEHAPHPSTWEKMTSSMKHYVLRICNVPPNLNYMTNFKFRNPIRSVWYLILIVKQNFKMMKNIFQNWFRASLHSAQFWNALFFAEKLDNGAIAVLTRGELRSRVRPHWLGQVADLPDVRAVEVPRHLFT